MYLQDDLHESYDEVTYEETVYLVCQTEKVKFPGGSTEHIGYGIVHYLEHTFIFYFPFSETETILVSVEVDVGRDLLTFIETCRQIIQEQS